MKKGQTQNSQPDVSLTIGPINSNNQPQGSEKPLSEVFNSHINAAFLAAKEGYSIFLEALLTVKGIEPDESEWKRRKAEQLFKISYEFQYVNEQRSILDGFLKQNKGKQDFEKLHQNLRDCVSRVETQDLKLYREHLEECYKNDDNDANQLSIVQKTKEDLYSAREDYLEKKRKERLILPKDVQAVETHRQKLEMEADKLSKSHRELQESKLRDFDKILNKTKEYQERRYKAIEMLISNSQLLPKEYRHDDAVALRAWLLEAEVEVEVIKNVETQNTLLHYAVKRGVDTGQFDGVNLLLERGAKLDCKNSKNQTPIEFARYLETEQELKTLLQIYDVERLAEDQLVKDLEQALDGYKNVLDEREAAFFLIKFFYNQKITADRKSKLNQLRSLHGKARQDWRAQIALEDKLKEVLEDAKLKGGGWNKSKLAELIEPIVTKCNEKPHYVRSVKSLAVALRDDKEGLLTVKDNKIKDLEKELQGKTDQYDLDIQEKSINHSKELVEIEKEHSDALQKKEAEYVEKLQEVKRKHAEELQKAEKGYFDDLQKKQDVFVETMKNHADELQEIEKKHNVELDQKQNEHITYLGKMNIAHAASLKQRDNSHAAMLEQKNLEYQKSQADLKRNHALILQNQKSSFEKETGKLREHAEYLEGLLTKPKQELSQSQQYDELKKLEARILEQARNELEGKYTVALRQQEENFKNRMQEQTEEINHLRKGNTELTALVKENRALKTTVEQRIEEIEKLKADQETLALEMQSKIQSQENQYKIQVEQLEQKYKTDLDTRSEQLKKDYETKLKAEIEIQQKRHDDLTDTLNQRIARLKAGKRSRIIEPTDTSQDGGTGLEVKTEQLQKENERLPQDTAVLRLKQGVSSLTDSSIDEAARQNLKQTPPVAIPNSPDDKLEKCYTDNSSSKFVFFSSPINNNNTNATSSATVKQQVTAIAGKLTSFFGSNQDPKNGSHTSQLPDTKSWLPAKDLGNSQ